MKKLLTLILVVLFVGCGYSQHLDEQITDRTPRINTDSPIIAYTNGYWYGKKDGEINFEERRETGTVSMEYLHPKNRRR